MTTAAPSPNETAVRVFPDGAMLRLRLLLHRRILYLRRQWQRDPLQDYQGLVISDTHADWLLAGDDAAAAARFYQEDPQAAELGRSIAVIERALAAGGAQGWPAIESLARIFGLGAFERDVLLLCLAPEMDSTIERLYAYVQDDVTRKRPSPELALALFAPGEIAARHALGPEAPLRRYRLVTLEGGALRIEERVFDYLCGANRPDERAAELLSPAGAAPLASAHEKLVERLAGWYRAQAGNGMWPVLNLVGPPASGRQAIAQAFCARLGLRLYRLDTARLPAPGPQRHELFRLLEREAALLEAAFFVDASETDGAEAAAHAIERLGAFLVVASRERRAGARPVLPVAVPRPTAAEQCALWRQALDGTPALAGADVERAAQQFDFGPGLIARTARAAREQAELHDCRPGADLLWQACREQASFRLDGLADRLVPARTWEDIVLPEDVLRQLREIAAQAAHRAQVYEAWGFARLVTRGRGISALFAGPTGTGKTMAAEVLASHLELDLYRIDLAGVVSKYIGETEKNLRQVFDAAERSGAILFFDEADALFGKRTEVKDSHDRYANIEVNYLLQRMEDYRGIAILATNRKSALDRAFLRRLRFLVDFPFPDAAIRRRIWEKVFPPQAPAAGLDLDFLSRLEIAGGNIRNVALNAAFQAAAAGAPIGMPHVMRAARREYDKIDRLTSEPEFGPWLEEVRR